MIADNDLTSGGRGKATYSEKGKWSDAGKGFADTKETYIDTENPFTMGTARKIESIQTNKKSSDSFAEWRPEIPERAVTTVSAEKTDAASQIPSGREALRGKSGRL